MENKFQDIIITRASIDNLKDIIYLWKYFIKDDTTPKKIEVIINDQREWRDRILICKIRNKIIGFIAYNIKNKIGHISGIVIDNQFRRNKYGTILLKSMEKELTDNNITDKITLEVRKDNINTLKFYENNGYKMTDIKKDYYTDIDALIFEKKI